MLTGCFLWERQGERETGSIQKVESRNGRLWQAPELPIPAVLWTHRPKARRDPGARSGSPPLSVAWPHRLHSIPRPVSPASMCLAGQTRGWLGPQAKAPQVPSHKPSGKSPRVGIQPAAPHPHDLWQVTALVYSLSHGAVPSSHWPMRPCWVDRRAPYLPSGGEMLHRGSGTCLGGLDNHTVLSRCHGEGAPGWAGDGPTGGQPSLGGEDQCGQYCPGMISRGQPVFLVTAQ